MCYDISVLTQSGKGREKPSHRSALTLTKHLQIAGFSSARAVVRSGLTVLLGALMAGILHIQVHKKSQKGRGAETHEND